MALEATVLCLDGSEYMRNGDYVPTRMEAMKDAAGLLCRIKTDVNPESTVGIVACGFPLGPKVLCSCSPDNMGALLTACSSLSIGGGKSDFTKGLQVSALALKHRRNKHGDQRIVAFVGSPVDEDEARLVKLGKNLKKNGIAVDVIAMGEFEGNEAKLKAFVEAVDKTNNSHLVVIPAGVLPSEVLMTSPVVLGAAGIAGEGEAGASGAGAANAAFAEYGGIDPSLDPELALAMRASMEEARSRMTAETGTAGEATNASTTSAPSEMVQTPIPASSGTAEIDVDEEEMLNQALTMSLKEPEVSSSDAPQSSSGEAVSANDAEDDEEARMLAMALAMSQAEEQGTSIETGTKEGSSAASASAPAAKAEQPVQPDGFFDASYVKELMEGLGDVDINDPQIQQVLAQMAAAQPKPPADGPDSKKSKQDEGEDK